MNVHVGRSVFVNSSLIVCCEVINICVATSFSSIQLSYLLYLYVQFAQVLILMLA
jgi:hypothetical protein